MNEISSRVVPTDALLRENTRRADVQLPPIQCEVDLAASYPSFEMQCARLFGEELVFEQAGGLDQALQEGFFLLSVPDTCELEAGDRFVRSCFLDPIDGDPFSGFKSRAVPGDYQGYFDREFDQWENFYIERSNWGLLPAPTARVGAEMSRIGVQVLRAVLQRLGVAQDLWGEATGGLTDGGGHRMLAFNHFRPDKHVRGCKFHRDSGWVTVLRSTEPGLLALIDGKLRRVDPKPGYFIINFGSSLEVFASETAPPVRGNIHGVAQTQRPAGAAHRYSYVVFLDSRLDGMIYLHSDARLQPLQSVAEFAEQEVSRTYDGNDSEL